MWHVLVGGQLMMLLAQMPKLRLLHPVHGDHLGIESRLTLPRDIPINPCEAAGVPHCKGKNDYHVDGIQCRIVTNKPGCR